MAETDEEKAKQREERWARLEAWEEDMSRRYWFLRTSGVPFGVMEGWRPLFEKMAEELLAIIGPEAEKKVDFRVEQVKEKLGGLCFYWSARACGDVKQYKKTYKRISAAVGKAEGASCVTCKRCGAPGERRGKGWITTRCDACYAKENTRR